MGFPIIIIIIIRIKKKVKKVKKRMKKNATVTPQVARNTRADAANTGSPEHARRRRQVSSVYTVRLQTS